MPARKTVRWVGTTTIATAAVVGTLLLALTGAGAAPSARDQYVPSVGVGVGVTATATVVVPDVIGKKLKKAKKIIKGSGLKPKVKKGPKKPNAKVVKENPKPGTTVAVGTKVKLKTKLGP